MVFNRFVFLNRIIDKYKSFLVDIVHNKIEIAIIIKIHIHGAVRHGRFIDARLFGSVRKSIILVIQI